MIETLVALLIAATIPAAQAQSVYRCVDEGGGVTFSQAPCALGAEEVRVRVARPREDEAESARERVSRLDAEAERRRRVAELVRNRKVAPGMTAQEVRRSLGEPVKVNRTVSTSGTSEQWIYEIDHEERQYVHLFDDVVTSVSD